MKPITFNLLPEIPSALQAKLGGIPMTSEQAQALVNLLSHNPGVCAAIFEAQSFEPLLNE